MTFLHLGTHPSGNLPTQRHSTTSSTGSQHDLPAPWDTPYREPPNSKAQHDQLNRQPARPSCASGHALQGTSRRKGAVQPPRQARSSCALGHALWGTSQHKGTARPACQAASKTFLRLRTRPTGSLPTQRHSTNSSTGSQHDLLVPQDTPLREPPNVKAQHNQLNRQPARPSCA